MPIRWSFKHLPTTHSTGSTVVRSTGLHSTRKTESSKPGDVPGLASQDTRGRPMSEAGRKLWWRAAIVAVLVGGAVIGGWVGKSRNAAAEFGEVRMMALLPREQPTRTVLQSPVPQTSRKVIPAAMSVPAEVFSEPAALPSLPPVELKSTKPVIFDSAVSGGGTPPTIPLVPASATIPPINIALPAPPPVPEIPSPQAVPPATAADPVIPTIAPIVPVLPPPSILQSAPPQREVVPPPLPAKSPESVKSGTVIKPDSDLQGGNTGNTVKTENADGSSAPPLLPMPGLEVPAFPSAPPVMNPIPTPPAVPVAGSWDRARRPLVDQAKPVETPLENSEKYVFPIPIAAAPTPGDSTVNRLKQSVAAALLGGLCFVPATTAAAGMPFPAVPLPRHVGADDKADIAALKTQVESVDKKLTDIQKDIKQLAELLNGRKDEKGFPLPSDPGIVAEMKKLKDSLAAIELDMTKLKTQSSSLRPPNAGNASVPSAAKGIVRVVNEYPVQISIVVNGTSYRVAPSKSMDVDVPAGEFTYQLLESGAASTRSNIKEKEVVTLRIK